MHVGAPRDGGGIAGENSDGGGGSSSSGDDDDDDDASGDGSGSGSDSGSEPGSRSKGRTRTRPRPARIGRGVQDSRQGGGSSGASGDDSDRDSGADSSPSRDGGCLDSNGNGRARGGARSAGRGQLSGGKLGGGKGPAQPGPAGRKRPRRDETRRKAVTSGAASSGGDAAGAGGDDESRRAVERVEYFPVNAGALRAAVEKVPENALCGHRHLAPLVDLVSPGKLARPSRLSSFLCSALVCALILLSRVGANAVFARLPALSAAGARECARTNSESHRNASFGGLFCGFCLLRYSVPTPRFGCNDCKYFAPANSRPEGRTKHVRRRQREFLGCWDHFRGCATERARLQRPEGQERRRGETSFGVLLAARYLLHGVNRLMGWFSLLSCTVSWKCDG